MDKIDGHLKICTEGKPLAAPRTNTVEPNYGLEDAPSTEVKLDKDKKEPPKKRVSSRRRKSYLENASKTGVVNIPLCFEEDKQFTTEFAYFVTTHLKKCYLTKAGGSRGACPLGFPGLACGHCAGEVSPAFVVASYRDTTHSADMT